MKVNPWGEFVRKTVCPAHHHVLERTTLAINGPIPVAAHTGTGFEPMTSRLCVPSTAFAALISRRDLWSGLYLHLSKVSLSFRCLPSSLYTFLRFLLGLARYCLIQVPPNLTGYLPAGFPTGRPTLSLASYRAIPTTTETKGVTKHSVTACC